MDPGAEKGRFESPRIHVNDIGLALKSASFHLQKNAIFHLREVGLTLLEDASRKGCGVEVPDLGSAAAR